MELRILFIWQAILTYCVYVVDTQSSEDETNLRANLSSGYNRFVRPSTPTNVTIYFNIRALQDLNIAEQELTVTGWMTLYWGDHRLTWDVSTYGFYQMDINWGWRPEFVITNSASGFTIHGKNNDDTRLRSYSPGFVRWNLPLRSVTSCDVDIANFPFDTQTCDIEVIFWSYDEWEVQLINAWPEVNDEYFLENAEWTFDSSTTIVEQVQLCCPLSTGPIFRIKLTFSRRRPFYVMNLIFPTVLLSVCMVWAFMLPTESGERLGYALTILLAYTVQLSITASLMPTTSKQVPRIAQYLLIVLVLCSVITCNVVMHVKLFYREDPVYGWLKAVYRKVYPVVFCTCVSRKQCSDSKVETITINRLEPDNISFIKEDLPNQKRTSADEIDQSDKEEEVTWAMVSVLLDRLCFYVYVIAVTAVNGWFLNSIV